MKNRNHDFSEYMNNSKTLFKMLFGDKMFKKLESTPLKSIDWNGIDIDTSDITATFPNIKKRFNDEWIENFSESGTTLFEVYLQTIFHYGYQQCSDTNAHYWDLINNLLPKNKPNEEINKK